MEQFLRLISAQNELGLAFDKKIFIPQVCLELNVAKRTIKEYLELLIEAGKVIEVKDKLWIPIYLEALKKVEEKVEEENEKIKKNISGSL